LCLIPHRQTRLRSARRTVRRSNQAPGETNVEQAWRDQKTWAVETRPKVLGAVRTRQGDVHMRNGGGVSERAVDDRRLGTESVECAGVVK